MDSFLDDTAALKPEWSRKCSCGRRFYQPNSYTHHINTCTPYKRGVGSSLQGAKERYKERKAQSKKGKEVLDSWFGDDAIDVDIPSLPSPGTPRNVTGGQTEDGPQVNSNPRPATDQIEIDAVDVRVVERTALGRGHRTRLPIQRFKEFTLTSAIPFHIPSIPAQDDADAHESGLLVYFGPETEPEARRRTALDESSWRETPRNDFGLYKRYWTAERTPHDPDLYVSPEDLHDIAADPKGAEVDLTKDLYPFPNLNSFLLGEWYWNDGNEKSRESFRNLVEIITSDDFDPNDIREAKWDKINSTLASSEFEGPSQPTFEWVGDGTSWHTSSVQLDVPFNSTSIQPGLHHYEVPDFRYRPLVPLITERLQDASRREQFHVIPTDLRWRRQEDGPDVRVYSELYHSPAFINAFKEVQSLPPEPTESHLPRYVVALMFASDETMLTSFGSAKLWPLYMLFGNESKHRRAKPSLKLFEEVAYFQSLPDRFQDWYLAASGKNNVGDPLYTYLNRELFQAQWRILLDDEFISAYRHGIVVMSPDGERRRFYPRVMTYSADYPERAAVVSIRNNGDHPCPRCLVANTDIHNMGSRDDRTMRIEQHRQDDNDRKLKIDQARRIIYKEHLSVNTKRIEELLKPTSLVPTKNAFSERLSPFGLNVYGIVAVDILHEVEIGVWKSLFIHLLRLLEAIDKAKLNILNARFRGVPGFGRDTIRRFGNNVSEMKQFAARNYEDLLQCAIPVFEGLFPVDHDDRALDLLFVFAHWHSLAKLRLHTDETLRVLDDWTSILGDECRRFSSETCNSFETQELQREYESRKRSEARKKKSKKKGKHAPSNQEVVELAQDSEQDTTGRKSKIWNINTPKFHSLGDVPAYIRMFGTTDSYSTQMSERFHRFPKAQYRRTNKKKTPYQISRIQTRQARIRKLRKHLTPSLEEGPSDADTVASLPYFIGKSQNQPVQLSRLVFANGGDPAVRDFIPKLKQHLLPRVVKRLLQEARLSPEDYPAALPILKKMDRDGPSALTDGHFNQLYLHSERIYQHAIAQFNYTTYDCRRDQDTVNPHTSRRDLMCFEEDSPHPQKEDTPTDAFDATNNLPKRFSYARLLGIFHANVLYLGPGMLDHKQRRFDFLWVRWYHPQNTPATESMIWSLKRPETVSFVPLRDRLACDFIDPCNVMRAAHIIPRFSMGKRYTPDADHSGRIFSTFAEDKEEWNEYYVNPFVDRDMLMRFHWGLAVGHTYSHPGTSSSSATDQPATSTALGTPGEPMDIDDDLLTHELPPRTSPEQSTSPLPMEEETDSDDSTYDRRYATSDDSVTDRDSDEEPGEHGEYGWPRGGTDEEDL